jgi:hypothetical protein
MGKMKIRGVEDRHTRLLKRVATEPNLKAAILAEGYSENTAHRQAKRTLETAIESVQERAIRGDATANEILEKVGLSSNELMGRYKYLVMESKNEAVSLKAMEPLLKTQGISWEDKQQASLPPVNIGIINTPPQETAQQSQIVDIQ